MSSSPLRPGASPEEELDHYKRQYEQLETDLADFQASSKELEEQLERDIETAERNERRLKEQVEKLTYEVDEWKTKHTKAKAESNSAQNALQKEITMMRETNRSLQLKLRDIEVVNDDYERQARNTESSLEDLESKYNVAIERGVLLEEEVKQSEQDRERLRIEAQRHRDELGDLKVENEITLEKLRVADETIERLRSRKPSPLAVESLRARSPASEASGVTPSSPTASTPPPKSDSASDAPTPPSPPLSDAPAHVKADPRTPMPTRKRSIVPDSGTTPRVGAAGARTVPRHSRGPSVTSSIAAATPDAKAARASATRVRPNARPSIGTMESTPRSESLYQIRNLRGRMQKIEERVHSARSKLPAPQNRTPRGSPRTDSALNDSLPASVTLRRTVRRPSARPTSSSDLQSPSESAADADATTQRRASRIQRLSCGIPRAPSSLSERPASALDRPPSAAASARPGSRTSLASSTAGDPRAGAHTPSGIRRPSSSIAGSYSASIHAQTPRSHRPSPSVNGLRERAAAERSTDEGDEEDDAFVTGVPSLTPRRSTLDRSSLFQTPAAAGASKRQSAGGGELSFPTTAVKSRASISGASGTAAQMKERDAARMMPPPPSSSSARRKRSDVGETY